MLITLIIAIGIAFTSLNVAILLAIRHFDKNNMQGQLEFQRVLIEGLCRDYLLLDCMQCVKGTSEDKPGVNWKGEPTDEQ